MNTNYTFRIKLLGTAGDGIISVGSILHQTLAHFDCYSTIYKVIPSSMKNGFTSALITISNKPILSPIGQLNVLFSLGAHPELDTTINCELVSGATVFIGMIKSENNEFNLEKYDKTTTFRTVPISQLSIYSPSFSQLGIILYTLDISFSATESLVMNRYSYNKSIARNYMNDLISGYLWAEKENIKIASFGNKYSQSVKSLYDGNLALSKGSIEAGCKFFSSYPITPATSIGDTLSKLLPLEDGVTYQAEDEIAALGNAIGASFSGVKSMTATSGPGFSLMQEMISYSSMIELPVVIVDVMRSGPSTGMPTRHGQDDLLAAIFGGHGEDQRIIIAPTSVEDCYKVAIDAFNCAEQYACPVIILSDYSLAFTSTTIDLSTIKKQPVLARKSSNNTLLPDNFIRYTDNNSIYPLLPAPGLSTCTYHVTGLEHDIHATPEESTLNHESQTKRRFDKIASATTVYSHLLEWDLEDSFIYNADISIISWGFTALICKEAAIILRNKGYKIAALYPKLLYPVCTKELEKLVLYCKKVVIPESNYTGQYASLLRMKSSLHSISILNTSGQPFSPNRLASEIEQIINENRYDLQS